MAQINKTREKGTGTIYKEGKRFYFKIRVNGKIKTQLLRDQEDKPVTTRQAAEKAAALLTPILRARQKEEIALYIADARNLKKRSSAQLDDLWTLFLSCSKHRDMAPGTLEVHHSARPCTVVVWHFDSDSVSGRNLQNSVNSVRAPFAFSDGTAAEGKTEKLLQSPRLRPRQDNIASARMPRIGIFMVSVRINRGFGFHSYNVNGTKLQIPAENEGRYFGLPQSECPKYRQRTTAASVYFPSAEISLTFRSEI